MVMKLRPLSPVDGALKASLYLPSEYINCHASCTSIVGPFGNDLPDKNHDSSEIPVRSFPSGKCLHNALENHHV